MNVDPTVAVFIDTNILVYAFDQSSGPKHSIAAQLLRDCWEHENGCLSIQVLQEFYVVVTRKIAAPLEFLFARQIVADLAVWRLHTPSAEDLLQAIDFQQRYLLSFWDAMVLQSAASLGCKLLVSEDLQHGQNYGGVRVLHPFKD